jgi:hypothetical protein
MIEAKSSRRTRGPWGSIFPASCSKETWLAGFMQQPFQSTDIKISSYNLILLIKSPLTKFDHSQRISHETRNASKQSWSSPPSSSVSQLLLLVLMPTATVIARYFATLTILPIVAASVLVDVWVRDVPSMSFLQRILFHLTYFEVMIFTDICCDR